jgi:hypothetical protein
MNITVYVVCQLHFVSQNTGMNVSDSIGPLANLGYRAITALGREDGSSMFLRNRGNHR